jgi:hypothetical protein
MYSPAPGGHPDPTSRHEYRYWDGARWTDDVADGGVASTDALGEGPPAAADPNPTASDPTQRVDPTRQYPVAGQQPTATSPPYYGDYYGTGEAPPPPARRGPPAGLIAALAVLAVALIGGLVYFLVRDDDDSSGDNAAEVSDADSTTTEGENPDGGDNANSGDSGSSDTTVSDDIDSENVDQLVELLADNMAEASGGVLTHEEATCISEGMLDELGVQRLADIGESGDNPFTEPEMASRLLGIIEDCGVSLEDLANLPD